MALLFAVACGLAVANAYHAQPLLYTIADEFGTAMRWSGLSSPSLRSATGSGFSYWCR
ncbi:hypothetical protein NO134_11595 [Ochrobactrum sp. BD22]|uniref:hypothetical protein n=1 Tax=Ochrobactrum sp. 3-3 TaxID=1830124 RepID=UPI0019667750|nr:hypothetical protein [Ochrobactrum sp. 3-3]